MSLIHLWLNLLLGIIAISEAKPVQPLKLDSIPLIALTNLRNQTSFSYTYKFKSSIPHNISGNFKGVVIFPNQEEREGVVVREKKKTNLKVKARGDVQYHYSVKTHKWELTPRGEESNILPVIDRAFALAKFEIINENNNYYTYKFTPTLSFLDPTLSRKIFAEVTIHKKTLLPVKIYARDSTQELLWQIEFSRYNQVKSIKFPFLSTTKIVLASEKKLAKPEIRSVTELLKKRLEMAGEIFRLNSKNKNNTTVISIELETPQPTQDDKLLKNLLTVPGELKIYAQTDSLPILTSSAINDVRVISFEPYPILEILLNDNGQEKINSLLALSDQSETFKILLDTVSVGTFSIDRADFSGKINFRSSVSKNEIMPIIAVIKSGTLSVPLKIISIEGNQ